MLQGGVQSTFTEILAPVWNINRRREGRWREQAAVRGCPHERGCGLSQPAVKDRQKGGGSENCSEACERRGDGAGLGCTNPDSLRWGPVRAGPGRRDRFQNAQTAQREAQRMSLTAPLGLGLLGLASSVASNRNGDSECQLKAE